MNVVLNIQMEQFRLASRELFNHYFLPLYRLEEGVSWDVSEGYARIRSLLFQTIVANRIGVILSEYGEVQKSIRVLLREGLEQAPALINRELNSGYWDHQIDRIDDSAIVRYEGFFDWEESGQMDNRYVRVFIESWPLHPEIRGKRALIDWMYVRFELDN